MSKLNIVAIHGAGGGSWEWDLWRAELNKLDADKLLQLTFHTVNLLPNPLGLEQTTFEDYVRQIVDVCVDMPRLYLVGASMGGPLVARAAEHLPNCVGLIFICTVVYNKEEASLLSDKELYPPIIRWSGGDSQETLDAIPDCTTSIAEWASQLWRDESGAVLNTAFHDGIDFKLGANLRLCCVIPMSDTTIDPRRQVAFAQLIKARRFEYEGMSHAGPLLGGIRVADVVRDVIRWILLE